MAALARMLDDVKTHIPNLIYYYLAIPEDMPGYRNFIPSIMPWDWLL